MTQEASQIEAQKVLPPPFDLLEGTSESTARIDLSAPKHRVSRTLPFWVIERSLHRLYLKEGAFRRIRSKILNVLIDA